jgi:hypothetical protein
VSNPREEDGVKELARALKESQDLKGVQFIGQRSIKSYKTFDPSTTYDYNFTLLQTDPIKDFTLTMTHDTGVPKALLELNIFARANNPDVMANPIPYRSPTAPPISVRWKKNMPQVDGETSWTVRVFKGNAGVASYEAYFKFFVDGTATGTISFVPL